VIHVNPAQTWSSVAADGLRQIDGDVDVVDVVRPA
jgi:predicted CoA-binding protein